MMIHYHRLCARLAFKCSDLADWIAGTCNAFGVRHELRMHSLESELRHVYARQNVRRP